MLKRLLVVARPKNIFLLKYLLRINKVEKHYWLRLIKDSHSMAEGTADDFVV
jgi:hypothetical protein